MALIQEAPGRPRLWTFREIQRAANQLANVMVAAGLPRHSRVAVLLGRDVEAALAHVAAWKAAMISVPMSRLFGSDALLHRLADSGARVMVTGGEGYASIAALRDPLPELSTVLLIDGAGSGAMDFWSTLERASDSFTTLCGHRRLNAAVGTKTYGVESKHRLATLFGRRAAKANSRRELDSGRRSTAGAASSTPRECRRGLRR